MDKFNKGLPNLSIYLHLSIYKRATLNFKQLEKISKALGDTNRLKILKAIQQCNGKLECTTIVSSLDLAQPSISHHLKKLQEAGLIEAHKVGRFYSYSLDHEVLDGYLASLKKL